MTATTTAAGTERRDALVEQIFHATTAALEVAHVYLGDRLGLYQRLAEVDSATPDELAVRAGIDPRYAREWLEQQAVSGVLDVAEDTGDAETRRFRLPAGAAEVLCDGGSLFHVTPLTSMAVGVVGTLDAVAEAFRTGGKVPFEAYGPAMRDGIARMNRPMFTHLLASEWVPALPDIDARLRAGSPPAQVADLGCGGGASSVALALGYPHARVDGIDLDEASVAAAREAAAAAGVSDRVTFAVRDAADPALRGRYDLVTLFETLHDMAHPVAVLHAARGLLAEGGAVLVGDQRVADRFTAPGDDLERFNYGWSATHCLAAAWGEPNSAGTGTVLRADTVRRYADEAGFSRATVLPIENDFWRFYRLDP